MLDRAAQALKDWRLYAKALTDYREGKISLAEPGNGGTRRPRSGWLAPTGSTSKPRSTRKPPPPANRPPPTWIASVSWHAVTLKACPTLLLETSPRFSSATAWCCAVPPTASTGLSSYPWVPGR
jgi:hypothetical protein